MRTRDPVLLMRVRRRSLAQRDPVHPDFAILHLPGVGQPVCDRLQGRQHLRFSLQTRPPLWCPGSYQAQLFDHYQHHVLQQLSHRK
jgi:hypothetical protein